MMHRIPLPLGLLGKANRRVSGVRWAGKHPGLEWNAECGELLGGMFHGRPVGITAHYDTYQRLGHRLLAGIKVNKLN
jgi:hypothetical protein